MSWFLFWGLGNQIKQITLTVLQQLDFESCEKWQTADQCYLFRRAVSELRALMNEIPSHIS